MRQLTIATLLSLVISFVTVNAQATSVHLECRNSNHLVQIINQNSIYRLVTIQSGSRKFLDIKKVNLEKNKVNSSGERITKIIEFTSDSTPTSKYHTVLEVNLGDGHKSKINGEDATCEGLADSSTYNFRKFYQDYFDRYDQKTATVHVDRSSICTQYDSKSNGYAKKCLNYEEIDNNGNYCSEYENNGGYGSKCKTEKNICKKFSNGYHTCLEYQY